MDQAIRLAVLVDHFARGMRAHALGRGIDEHHMNSGAAGIAQFKAGWRQAEHDARRSRENRNQAGQQLGEVSPP